MIDINDVTPADVYNYESLCQLAAAFGWQVYLEKFAEDAEGLVFELGIRGPRSKFVFPQRIVRLESLDAMPLDWWYEFVLHAAFADLVLRVRNEAQP